MKITKVARIFGIIVIIALLAIFAGMGFLFLDIMSSTATGSETLSPAGATTGNALVVYDPGVTGAAKDAATEIADDLRAKGYRVELAGVESPAAANISGYDVIVVGGPTYVGNVSGSIRAYYGRLSPAANAAIGAFATGGIMPESNDPSYMRTFVTSLPDDNPLKIKACLKLLSGDDAEKRCDGFTTALLR